MTNMSWLFETYYNAITRYHWVEKHITKHITKTSQIESPSGCEELKFAIIATHFYKALLVG